MHDCTNFLTANFLESYYMYAMQFFAQHYASSILLELKLPRQNTYACLSRRNRAWDA